MAQVITAVYEKGVFKPMKKIPLKEHEKVKLIIRPECLTDKTSGLVRIGKKLDLDAEVAMITESRIRIR